MVSEIKSSIFESDFGSEESKFNLHTIECSIMDFADDIANSTYDLEDALKLDTLDLSQILFNKRFDIYDKVIESIKKDIQGQIEKFENFLNFESGGGVSENYKQVQSELRKYQIQLKQGENSEDDDPEIYLKTQHKMKSLVTVFFLFIIRKSLKDEEYRVITEALNKLKPKMPEINELFTALNLTDWDETKKILKQNDSDETINSFDFLQIFRNFNINGYYRNNFTSQLVKNFMSKIKLAYVSKNPKVSFVYLPIDFFIVLKFLKHFVYEFVIKSPMLQVTEYRGAKIVEDIFNTLVEHPELLPDDFKNAYEEFSISPPIGESNLRVICDFVAGMTDRYALEFYEKLHSTSLKTIFKPL
ncbi:MAG: hypothetical protein HRT47_02830 [Candidatus Caenarcaniphilales bacterium]|nr:hypothetical protein [Candidatus Caenarcaniphilales bacterium]